MAPVSLAGRTVSHYRVAEEISRGGMGVVYRATDLRLGRDVALKVLPPELVADTGRRERFVQEARAASALEHPNIAAIHDIGEADGVSFIVMELIRGDKLSDAIARGDLSRVPGRVLEIAAQVGEGLARAHAHGIVHRDLKPANVMLTEDGHAKVIDFGLAKLVAPLDGDARETFAGPAVTDPHVVMGTTSYMSPEQARGGAVDHRTDIFSFGVMLYEMLTGTLPFRGQSSIDTLHAILHDPPLPLPRLGGGLTGDEAADAQRIVEKCLSKDPNERYQGMKDLVVDLRAARRRMDSAPTFRSAPPPEPAAVPKRRSRALAGIAAATLLMAAAAGGWMLWNRNTSAPAVEATGTRPSVAVLYFENNTGNPEMDWLRTGLTDMLVTDLSQSSNLEVLGTDRLVQILGDLRKLDDRVIAFDTVQEVARRAGVKNVLLGSYVKAGDAIRINLKLQEAASGRIISAERVEAANEGGIFQTMDELTRRILTRFVPASAAALLTRPGTLAPDAPLDMDLKDVTSASIEAYRYYAQGIDFHNRGRSMEALPLLEKATAIDPNFALAFTKIAVIHGNTGRSDLRDQFAQKALSLVGRLTPRERYYIEGFYYTNRAETVGRAIEAYSKALELYPDHSASRNNLALIFLIQNQLDKAIEHYRILQERGFEFPGAAGNLAAAYVANGQPAMAIDTIGRYIARYPAAPSGHFIQGQLMMSLNRLDEADAAFEKFAALTPPSANRVGGPIRVALLRGNWEVAGDLAESLSKDRPVQRLMGAWLLAIRDLYRGQSARALKSLEAGLAASAYGPEGSNETANVRNFTAELLLARDQPADALRQATHALEEARGRSAAPESRMYIALSQSYLGRSKEAEAELDELVRLVSMVPGTSRHEYPDMVRALSALRAGNPSAALEALGRVEALMVRGPVAITAPSPLRQPAAVLWYWTGEALLAAKRDEEAAAQFTRLVDSGFSRLFVPVEYVRSWYRLAEIADRRGDQAKAREHYRRFLSYWSDGDLDREWVREATRKSQ